VTGGTRVVNGPTWQRELSRGSFWPRQARRQRGLWQGWGHCRARLDEPHLLIPLHSTATALKLGRRRAWQTAEHARRCISSEITAIPNYPLGEHPCTSPDLTHMLEREMTGVLWPRWPWPSIVATNSSEGKLAAMQPYLSAVEQIGGMEW
jgi:hypothetical protein